MIDPDDKNGQIEHLRNALMELRSRLMIRKVEYNDLIGGPYHLTFDGMIDHIDNALNDIIY